MIQNLQQQQQGRIVDPKVNEFEHENLNIGQGNFGDGNNNHGGNGVEDLPKGMPRGNEPKPRENLQPQPLRSEYLCERLCKMKLPSFERSTNSLDAEEWLSSMETILYFMELNDKENIICAAYMLKKEARYWWEAVKTRRNVLG